jgi:sacsin
VVSETDKHATVLLDFLIQSQDIHLLIGLPLLKNIEGYYVTLKRLDSSNSPTAVKQTIHPMFEAQSAQLFKEYDPQAISLHELKHSHATYIRNNAPGFLNVIDLTAEKVAEYLSTDPRWTTPLLTTTSSIITSPSIPFEISQWLSKFYTWLSSQPFVDTFFHLPGIQQLYLVPTQLGLRRVGDVTFDNVTPALGKCLRALGICVLDAVAGPTPRKLLVNASVLKKAEDIHLIIDCANNGVSSTGISSTSLGLTCVEWRVLIDHIVRYMTTEELHPDEARKLRSLPIYPILPADSLNAIPTPSPGAIPENKFVYAVTSVEILPVIDACVLLDFRELRSYDILRFLDPKSPPDDRPLTPVQVFELVVQNFGSQTPEIRSSIVRFGAKNEKIIPRDSLEKLLEMPSIVCRDDQARKPEDVVDPTSKIDLAQHVVMCSRLSGSESTFDGYLPRSDSQTDREIVEGFRGLRSSPFKQHLDQALLIKMTSCISRNADQPESIVISKKLFKVLASNPTYADFVRAIPHEDKWIATNSGLRAQHACRDRDADWDIFDDVYAVVDDDITVPHALRGALGWLEEISLDALFSRLDVTLKKAGDFSRVRDVVKRIGSIAGVSDPDLDQLRLLLGDRSWVPTRAGKLVRPEDAVLDHAIDEAGIFEVSFNQAAYPEVIEFLKRMGVRDRYVFLKLNLKMNLKGDRPTTTIILARIREKAPGPLIGDEVTTTMKLLSSLVEDLSPEFKAQVLVPDVDGLMRRVSELYFNDTGISISIPDSPHTQRAIAHFLLPEALARKLGIEPLAKSYSRFSGYMGESFLSSIRSVMRDYTETQTLVEMLANAADAGAKRFIVIVDEMRQSAQISSKLRVFQESAALLVYNDAKFTNRDFEGLCNTGEGSKRDQGDSIGQFGRGALTMFHFTEVCNRYP